MGQKKEGADAPSNERFSEDAINMAKTKF